MSQAATANRSIVVHPESTTPLTEGFYDLVSSCEADLSIFPDQAGRQAMCAVWRRRIDGALITVIHCGELPSSRHIRMMGGVARSTEAPA